MLRHWRTSSAALLILVGLALAIGAREGSSSFQECISDHKTSGAETQQIEGFAHLFVALLHRSVAFRCTGVFIDKNDSVITAIATVFIAIFTVVLAVVTNRQARLTRESIDLGNKEFISTHRPKLRVRLTPAIHAARSPIVIQYDVVNIGGTRARVLRNEIVLSFWFDEVSTLLWAQEGGTGKEIAAGESVLMQYQVPENFKSAFARDLTGRESRVRVWLQYLDDNGAKRTTAIYRRYDPIKSRFRRMQPTDPDEEYED